MGTGISLLPHFMGQSKSQSQPRFMSWGKRPHLLMAGEAKSYFIGQERDIDRQEVLWPFSNQFFIYVLIFHYSPFIFLKKFSAN